MLTALILIVVVAAIVVASRRWPDVEHRLWPKLVRLPKSETAEPPHPKAEPHHKPAHPVHHQVAHPAPAKPKPAATHRTAGGLMTTREITVEPEVTGSAAASPADDVGQPDAPVITPAEPDAAEEPPHKGEPTVAELVAEEAKHPKPSKTKVVKEELDEPVDPAEAKESPAAVAPPEPATVVPDEPDQPGARVTGSPAMPSEPAYFDATSGVNESVEELARQADQAFRDRDYERAEQACLKILVQQPKNHKYMTRIGQVYQEMGNLDDAKEAYEAAKNLDPKNFFVLNRLAEVDRQLSDKGGRSKSSK